MILIAPVWQSQPWYPQLMELLVAKPRLLPVKMDLLTNPRKEVHPLVRNNSLRLAAWKVSGKDFMCKEFQQGLPTLSQNLGDQDQQKITSRPGKSGLAGVLGQKLIHFDVL